MIPFESSKWVVWILVIKYIDTQSSVANVEVIHGRDGHLVLLMKARSHNSVKMSAPPII